MRKVNQIDQARGIINVPTTGGTVVVVTGTAKKKVSEQKNKGRFFGFSETHAVTYSNQVLRGTFFILIPIYSTLIL